MSIFADNHRSSGVLLAISSLPSNYGIGSLGKEAYRFIRFLANTGQRYWQMLPVGPTGFQDSPYQSFSSYAGNPYFIDLEMLMEEGLLDNVELEEVSVNYLTSTVAYDQLFKERRNTLYKAFLRFSKENNHYQEFCQKNAFWLQDYALFMAIKKHHHYQAWNQWEEKYRFKETAAILEFSATHQQDIQFEYFLQYLFFNQWQKLKEYSHQHGVKFIGDLPFYVAADSADVWTNPSLFHLDEKRNSSFVGGCPPDDFSIEGQLWGNPCYEWSAHAQQNYRWWIKRIEWSANIFDVVRLDHFRGFSSYWQIPANEIARNGKWVKANGIELFTTLLKSNPHISIIAEDLGYITDDVKMLLALTSFPGMKVLQFAFSGDSQNPHLPHNFEKNCVVYTATHDNTTTSAWCKYSSKEEFSFAQNYLGLNLEEGYSWGFLRAAFTSCANLVICPVQDLLSLDESGRLNCPGNPSGNWQWKLDSIQHLESIQLRLYYLTKISGRL